MENNDDFKKFLSKDIIIEKYGDSHISNPV